MKISGQPDRIDLTQLRHELAAERAADGAEKIGPQKADSSSTRDTQVEQRTLSLLSSSLLQGDDIRTEKVDALRGAIAEGSYAVEPQQIADAMIHEFKV